MQTFFEPKLKFFIDFDDTITKIDVGESIFLQFGETSKVQEILDQIDNRTITAVKGWELLFEAVPNFDQKRLDEFIDLVEIDSFFLEFLQFAKEREYKVFILSDGFDYYINRILDRYNIDIPKYSNCLEIFETKTSIKFPYRDEECKNCAHCKRNRVLELSSDEEFTVYIGNGQSDICPAQYCDLVFAKDYLRSFCEKEKISYSSFIDFADVISKTKEICSRKRIKKLRQAELKRREVYLQG